MQLSVMMESIFTLVVKVNFMPSEDNLVFFAVTQTKSEENFW